MNLMHKNLQVTDGVYGIFSKIDIQIKIAGLSKKLNNQLGKEEIIKSLEKVILSMKNN